MKGPTILAADPSGSLFAFTYFMATGREEDVVNFKLWFVLVLT